MTPFVSVLMGSKSDYETMEKCADTLKALGVPYELIVSSAHRTPVRTKEYVADAENRGAVAFICAAGLAAHLAGAVAAITTKPVIGVPMKGGVMDGADALLSTVQMPGGMPVATVAVGSAGAKNAAYLAAQIMAIGNETLAAKLKADREEQARKVEEDSKSVEVRL